MAMGLLLENVWVRYYGMGVAVSRFELKAYLDTLFVLQGGECDILANATN